MGCAIEAGRIAMWLQRLEKIFAAGFFEPLDEIADLLGAASVGNEQCVGSIDDDQVLDAEQGDELFAGIDVVSRTRLNQGIGAGCVALRVALVELVNGVPASDVVPADVAGGDACDVRSSLKNGIIDRDVFATGKNLFELRERRGSGMREVRTGAPQSWEE